MNTLLQFKLNQHLGALMFALFAGAATPVLADDDRHRGHGYHHDRDRGHPDAYRHYKRGHHAYYPAPYYVPPRVIYAPPPPVVYYPSAPYRSGVNIQFNHMF